MRNKIKKILPRPIMFFLVSLHITIIKLMINIFNILPINKNKVLISSYYGKGWGDNGKYIAQKLLNTSKEIDIVWAINNKNIKFPERVRTVKVNSIKYYFELCTAKIWVDNCRKSYLLKKRENQYYIQTWHGGVALKRIEKDVEDNLGSMYVKNAKNDSKMADLFVSNSKFCSDLYKNCFWYDGSILECGYPRNDIFFNYDNDTCNRIRGKIKIPCKHKVVLYAPTFRQNHSFEEYSLDYEKCISALGEKYGGDWTLLIRFHPNISNIIDVSINKNNNIINVTNYSDMQELMLVSDILITDYSSTMFEFSLLKKGPVFIFATDIDNYINERNFYFGLEQLPYPLSKSNNELKKEIMNFNYEDYLHDLNKFGNSIGMFENGQASETIANIIRRKMKV